MRTRLLASAGIAALLLAAPAAGDATDAKAKPKPRLALVDPAPLTLRGTSFVRRERVRVLVTSEGRTAERRAVASARGSFSVVFPDLQVHRCSWGFSAQAIGTNGSRAVLKLPPQPLCPPPLRS